MSSRFGNMSYTKRRLAPLSLLVALVASLVVPLIGTGVAVAAGPDPVGTIYVSDYFTNRIDVFAAGTNGNVAPIRTISGSHTRLNGPRDVVVDSAGNVFASNQQSNTITVYGPGASGNAAPIRTISGSNTGLSQNDDMFLAADGTLYVGNFVIGVSGFPPSVVVFAPGASGNVAPIRTISSSMLGSVDGLGADATGTLYVDGSDSIQVFAPGADGNVAPVRSISGLLTGLSQPNGLRVGLGGDLFVLNRSGGVGGLGSVEQFAPGASGNVAPLRTISGPMTGFANVDDLAVDSGGTVYVTGFDPVFGSRVGVFAPGASGNVTPQATITGPLTTLFASEGVDVAKAPAASLTTTTSPSVGLGSSTHDTATLSGGTNPTGSMIFKLFGPSDSTCSAAPAFISPVTTVSGNGNYTSPNFTPTAAGTYSWVALTAVTPTTRRSPPRAPIPRRRSR